MKKREFVLQRAGGRIFQEEGATCAKVLRLEHTWFVQGNPLDGEEWASRETGGTVGEGRGTQPSVEMARTLAYK